jgi:hypothetical protein
MSNKLKALGLGLIAAMAMSAMVVVNATAQTGGHFVSSASKTTLTGTEGGTHVLHFKSEGGAAGSEIGCTQDSYTGTVSAETVTSVDITPTWNNCFTTGSPGTIFDIEEQSCFFRFTVGPNPEGHNTAHVVCSKAGDAFVIKHPNCTIRVPPQEVNGVAYKTTVENGVHAITLESTVKNITAHYEAGFCVFLGTTHTSEMNGSVTVRGTSGTTPVGVTATG